MELKHMYVLTANEISCLPQLQSLTQTSLLSVLFIVMIYISNMNQKIKVDLFSDDCRASSLWDKAMSYGKAQTQSPLGISHKQTSPRRTL